MWVCSCLWCLVPEFLVIFDCILVFTFEKFGMSGCGVGEKYFPPERVCSRTPGDTTCPRLPEAKLKSGVFALPRGFQRGCSSWKELYYSGFGLHQGRIPEGRVSCYFHLPWAWARISALSLGEAVSDKSSCLLESANNLRVKVAWVFCIYLVFLSIFCYHQMILCCLVSSLRSLKITSV